MVQSRPDGGASGGADRLQEADHAPLVGAADAHGADTQADAQQMTPVLSFDEWCDRLRALSAAEPNRYGPDAVANCGADSWRTYYENDYSPEDAWAEDGTYVE